MDILGNLFNVSKKAKVVNDLYKLGIPPGKYEILENLSVNLNGDFTLKSEEARTWTTCPVKFNAVYGNFIWHYGSLTSLINMPNSVTKNFSVAYNNLKNLQYSPTSVGAFVCSGNNLENLKGCPRVVGTIIAVNCNLTSLEGVPNYLTSLIVGNNNLTSLSFLPTIIETSLDISNNKITSFDELKQLRTRSDDRNSNVVGPPTKFYFEGNPCEKQIQEYLDNNNYKILRDSSNPKSDNKSNKPEESPKPEEKTIDTSKQEEGNRFVEGDYVILDSENSKYHNLKGRIKQVNPNNTYTVLFDKERNETLEKDGVLFEVKPHYLIKDTPTFHIGDYVIFRNKSSKFDSTIGEITEILPNGGNAEFKIKALMSENPNLDKVANATSISRGWSIITNIVANELTKIEKPKSTKSEKSEYEFELVNGNNFKPGEKAYYYSNIVELIAPINSTTWKVKNEYGTNIQVSYTLLTKIIDPKDIVLDPANRFSIGDKALYYTSEVELIAPVNPKMWRIKYSNGTTITCNYDALTPIAPVKYNEGDQVIITDKVSRYFNKIGTIVKSNDENNELNSVDIEIESNNNHIILNSFSKKNIKLYYPPKKEDTTAGRVFAKGDKIIYIAHKNNTSFNEYHLRKGEISYVNTAPNLKDTYDLTLDKIKTDTYEKRINNISWTNIFLLSQDFNLGDKVVIFEPTSEYHDIVAIITEIGEDGTYKVAYNDGSKIHTVKSIKPNQMVEFRKPIGSECNVDDNIKYTKPNSRYYGLTGVIIKFDKSRISKPYAIEIITKDGSKEKIWADDIDLETIPGPRNFKIGDTIRYNNPGHRYDGYIGEISSLGGNNKNRVYSIILKYGKGNIYLEVKADKILLLEEAPESSTLKVGDKVKYTNDKSKWNGKIGEYIGFRVKDGKNQLGIKFQESTNLYKTIYFDEGEGKLDVVTVADTKPATTTNFYNNSTSYTRKKKKEYNEEEPRKPILVYNRRQSVRKAKPKPKTEETAQEEDK